MKAKTSIEVMNLGDAAFVAIEKYFHKTIAHEADVLKDKDPEELHQMRVGMRRLRSAAIGFAPVLDLPKEAEERKIGKVARVLGNLRDLDVILESLQNQYYPNLPEDEREVLDKALLNLVKQRHRTLKAVKNVLQHKTYQQLKNSLEDWLEKPKYHAISQLPIAEVLPDLLLPQISEFFLHPGWMLGAKFDNGSVKVLYDMSFDAVEAQLAAQGTVLHDLRKQAKRVRYLMNLFGDFYGDTYEAYVEDVKEVQECLGEIQDTAVLEEFLGDIFEFELKKKLPQFEKLLAESRYASWQKWQILQRRYLSSQVRQNFRSALIRPVVRDAVNGDVSVES
jgi:CHAD domain-containing protein